MVCASAGKGGVCKSREGWCVQVEGRGRRVVCAVEGRGRVMCASAGKGGVCKWRGGGGWCVQWRGGSGGESGVWSGGEGG